MCGIAGFWTTKPDNCNRRDVAEKMLAAIDHRGPDGRGVFHDDAKGITLGHTRLSIIDLNTGAQPLYSSDKKITYVGNGEFYDYKKMRAQLAAEGESFETKSDNELAIKLYQKFGTAFVEHLRGEFAFCLYDESEQRMTLVRDRFGVRPLFFKATETGFYFGSEMKAMLKHPDVKPTINRKAAIHQLMQTMAPGDTLFEGIEALAPGHMLIVERQGDKLAYKTKEYWDLTFPVERQQQRTADEWVEAVRETLIESIALRLEADVPVACYLSGGIDSCSIYGLASALQQSPVTAFTIGFASEGFDETEIAKLMTTQRRADHKILPVTSEDLYGDNYTNTVWHSERTFYNTLGVAKFLLSRMVLEHKLKVVITGEGSDELFSGYPFFKSDVAGTKYADQLLGEKYKAFAGHSKQFKGFLLTEADHTHPDWQALCGFTPEWLQNWASTHQLAKNLHSDKLNADLSDYDPLAAIASRLRPDRIEGRHPLDIAQYTWVKTMLEGQILNWGGDRVDMAHSLETRPAFLDHKLAELATQIPPEFRLRQGTEKWVLREAVKGVLPEQLYKREKFPFMAPPAYADDVKLRELRKLTNRFLTADKIEAMGILDPRKTQAFVDDYFSERDAAVASRMDGLINHILSLHIFYDQVQRL